MQTAKLVLDEYFSGELEQFGCGIEFFSLEEEAAFAPPIRQSSPKNPTTAQAHVIGRELSLESNVTSESEETYKARTNSESSKTKPKKSGKYIFLTYL